MELASGVNLQTRHRRKSRAIALRSVGGVMLLACTLAGAQDRENLLSSPLAAAFGAPRAFSGADLSPDGRKVSFIGVDAQDVRVLGIIDLDSSSLDYVLAGEPGGYQVDWCGWANETRLLCGMSFFGEVNRQLTASSRLIAIDSDSSDVQVILPFRLGRFQDNVLDWIPDDPEHVLITIPTGIVGESVARLNIYDATLSDIQSEASSTVGWLTDGHGELRGYVTRVRERYRWHARAEHSDEWQLVHDGDVYDWDDKFDFEGFGTHPDELLIVDDYDGRLALYAIDLGSGPARRLIFAHPQVDIDGLHFLGKYHRPAAVVYAEDRLRLQFFDGQAMSVHGALQRVLGDKDIIVVDEDWHRQNYLVHASSDTDPGVYYHFDVAATRLTMLGAENPTAATIPLSPVRSIEFTARDGTRVPGYLTLPLTSEKPPAVVLPHGGPEARDYWGYNYLVQFLAANGYAALQVNFRGSSGYGDDWIGEGAFRNWENAVGDIVDGARYIADEKLVDPDRICVAGWSFGGYAALLSAAETENLFSCVVSIAGVRDLSLLTRALSDREEDALGITRDVIRVASPADRADEIGVPVLLIHGKWDLNVPFGQSERMERVLRRANVPVEFVEYEDADHYIEQQRYRIDLLTRLALFLDLHIGRRQSGADED